jgi:hypothetical protein
MKVVISNANQQNQRERLLRISRHQFVQNTKAKLRLKPDQLPEQ